MTRIAIATSRAGHGPITAAHNLALALSRISDGAAEVSVIDLPREFGGVADLAINRLYNLSLRHGLLWNRLGVGASFRLDWARLGRFVARRRTAPIGALRGDAVVFTTPWLLERALDGLHSRCATYSVVLDLGPPLSPGWDSQRLDHVYAPTEEAREALGGRAEVLGIPVFPPRTDGRARGCERCEGGRSVLAMGGRFGYAGIPSVLRALGRQEGLHVTALAGREAGFRAAMERLASRTRGHVEVLPFAPDVPSLMAAHDVVLSRPGTMTIGEALAHGRPLLLDASRGLMPQEVGNARFVEGNGAGLVVRSVTEVPGAVDRLLTDASFVRAAQSLAGIAGAERIAGAILTGG